MKKRYATTSLKLRERNINITKKQPQVDIGHYPQKWKLVILGVSFIGHGIGGMHIPAKMAQLAESQSLE
jgi:hypothetical protein